MEPRLLGRSAHRLAHTDCNHQAQKSDYLISSAPLISSTTEKPPLAYLLTRSVHRAPTRHHSNARAPSHPPYSLANSQDSNKFLAHALRTSLVGTALNWTQTEFNDLKNRDNC
jgi:hypothetical protein